MNGGLVRTSQKQFNYIEAPTREELFTLMDRLVIQDGVAYNYSEPKLEGSMYVTYYKGKPNNAARTQRQLNEFRQFFLNRAASNGVR